MHVIEQDLATRVSFFFGGKGRECAMHHNTEALCVGLHHGLPVGPKALWMVCHVSYPLNTPLTRVSSYLCHDAHCIQLYLCIAA